MDKFLSMTKCDRCGESLTGGRIMSTYNHQCLCLKCKAAEEKRSDYHVALEMERQAVKHGVCNYPGIGLGRCFSESLRTILPVGQRQFVESLLYAINEDTRLEAKAIIASAEEQARVFESMPKTGEQDGKGDKAVAYLHFFTPIGNGDWWIIERDMESRQLQAFGLVRLFDTEIGYINIEELQACPQVELDFYWKPTMLGKIRERIGDA